jgi:hypothetical protein
MCRRPSAAPAGAGTPRGYRSTGSRPTATFCRPVRGCIAAPPNFRACPPLVTIETDPETDEEAVVIDVSSPCTAIVSILPVARRFSTVPLAPPRRSGGACPPSYPRQSALSAVQFYRGLRGCTRIRGEGRHSVLYSSRSWVRGCIWLRVTPAPGSLRFFCGNRSSNFRPFIDRIRHSY